MIRESILRITLLVIQWLHQIQHCCTSDLLKQDVLVEPTGKYLRRVTGVTVREPAAGN